MGSTAAPPLAVIRIVAADIKLSHSIFALPFALLAAFMAASGDGAIDWSRFPGQLVLIVLAMVFARTVAMLANRYLDRDVDARNPRTAGRAIPSGRLAASTAVGAMVVNGSLFMLVCAAFGWLFGNWWPVILGLPVLAWISAYGWLKRWTALCHLWLGSSLAISPLAAAIAIEPVALAHQPALWLLSAMVLFWVAGFDIIYALQDVQIDRRDGLYSMPATLGEPGGILVSRGLHVLAAGALVAAWLIDPRFAAAFGTGVFIVLALLVYEHATVARWGTTRLALAFFTLNGVISCLLGGLGILDILIP